MLLIKATFVTIMKTEKLIIQVLNSTLPISLITFMALGCTSVAQPNSNSGVEQNSSVQYCTSFDLELPEDFAVYGADTYTGSQTLPYPIDDSDHAASETDIIVNSPAQPVVLLLGAHEPNVWDIQWTEDTEILGVVAYGAFRQGIAGLPKDTPVLINTFEQCGEDDYFETILGDDFRLEELSQYLFDRPLEQNPSAYRTDGFVLGEPVVENSVLLGSNNTSVESFFDRNAPRVERLGIEDAIEQGVLREATMEDVETWVEAHLRYRESSQGKVFFSAQERESYKDELIESLEPKPYLNINDSYVVLGDFTYPAGLYANAPTFFVAEGVPKPSGYPGHSSVHDFSGQCLSTVCEILTDNITEEM